MRTAQAQRLLLERLGSAGTVLLAVHLALPEVPAWADGADADGRAVVLVGRQQLGAGREAQAAVRAVLGALGQGYVPAGVCSIGYAPRASAFIAEAVAGAGDELLADGPRASGKTQAVPAALGILAERHARAGFPLPLQALWLHDSLTNAAIKTGRSLEQALWGGLWRVVDDRRAAVLTLAGADLARVDFVGTRDETAAERLRAECHVLAAEELVPSLDESGGIEERRYELALTSRRLPTLRRVALATTNPGGPDTWPFRRWLEAGGRPGCVRCEIPAADRLTEAEQRALAEAFRDAPDLQARLARGEWAELVLGEVVAVGFRDHHVAPGPLPVVPGVPLVMGHDAGLTPVTVIGQPVAGEVRVLAALASERAGTRQHLESLVQPWLATRAPWAIRSPSMLLHYYDPSMDTADQSNLEQSPLRVLREVLGGAAYPGAASWPGRRDPMLTLLTRLSPVTGRPALQLDPEGCRLLISALRARWHYPTVAGVVSRELPAKTHPWSDLGDAFCYLVGGSVPAPDLRPREIRVETAFDLRALLGAGPRPW